MKIKAPIKTLIICVKCGWENSGSLIKCVENGVHLIRETFKYNCNFKRETCCSSCGKNAAQLCGFHYLHLEFAAV